ncbi:DUF4190 domain-containing protein [Pseudonocardia sp.]|jgi:hypothetical protein|uniref:DUF4190 domain-containing protein n=1 Tax=Pseudonocardia sp. TaxID=60912 RepID=UPI003D0E311F
MNPQPPNAQYPPPPGYAPQQPRQNGLGTAGFVLGLVGLVFSFIPVIGIIAWPLVIVGLVLSIIGFTRTRSGRADNRGLAIAGIVLSVAGLLMCILYAAVFTAAAGAASTAADDAARAGGYAAGSGGTSAPVAFGQTVTVSDIGYSVSTPAAYTPSAGAAALGGEIARAVRFDVTITNNSATPFAFNPFVVGAKASAAGADAPQITDIQKKVGVTTSSTILPGKSLTYGVAFSVPEQKGDVQVELSPTALGSPIVFTGTA